MSKYRHILLSLSCVVYAFDQYVNYRQHRLYLITDRPKNLTGILTEQDFRKSQAYNLDKSKLVFVQEAFKQVQIISIIYLDCLPKLWSFAGDLIQGQNETYQSLTFYLLFIFASTLTSLPFRLFSIFVIEDRHGFNNQTLGLFFKDIFKSYLFMTCAYFIVIPIFLYTVRSTGDLFYFYLWMLGILLQLFLISLYPSIIQPLFEKLTVLESGELRQEIERLASRIQFPLKNLRIMDGSRRSNHSNAYFYGLATKHIVLFDTLIRERTPGEICAILGHELGHWQMSHNTRLFLIQNLYRLTFLKTFSLFLSTQEIPVLSGLVIFEFLWSPMELLGRYLINKVQRKHEYQADMFALSLGYTELSNVLIKLCTVNLDQHIVDPWYACLNHSHPTLVERLDGINKKNKI